MSPAASWRGADPRASPGRFGPTPWVLPLIRSPHDWNYLLLRGWLHWPTEKVEGRKDEGLATGRLETEGKNKKQTANANSRIYFSDSNILSFMYSHIAPFSIHFLISVSSTAGAVAHYVCML